ncbi:MAG: hypothetical protein RL407_1848 [Bacteroidota bacterium]|jgi:hypothetical protein
MKWLDWLLGCILCFLCFYFNYLLTLNLMETFLISLILLLVLILVVVTIQEIASNTLLPFREKLSFIAIVIGCPPFGILFYHIFKRKRQKKVV